jgi:hypothetical protein
LPLKTAILVSEGQTCVGGETIIADLAMKNRLNQSLKLGKEQILLELKKPRRILKPVPIAKLIPNILTLIGLVVGG